MDAYLAVRHLVSFHLPQGQRTPLLIFSFEFGLHESLPVYAGGLGILSGDHLKSFPISVCLWWGWVYLPMGIFRSTPYRGWLAGDTQRHYRLQSSSRSFPCWMKTTHRSPHFRGTFRAQVFARIWEMAVGRVRLYLLDSNVEQIHRLKQLTERLYSNDLEVRISQGITSGHGRSTRYAGWAMIPLSGI